MTDTIETRPISATLLRLRRIQPGERIIYYRGIMDNDLERATGDYRALLEDIKDEAERLHREGVATLERKRVERAKKVGQRHPQTRRWTEYAYIATGCSG